MSEERRVQHVLARYVRAADHRDGEALGGLFVADAELDIFQGHGEAQVRLGRLEGAQSIGAAVAGLLAPHPPLGWSHHTTSDPIIEVIGNQASFEAQFVVFNTVGRAKPADGWPMGASGAQGTVQAIEAGYYRSKLVRRDGSWLIAKHRINLDLPAAFPGA